MQAPHAGRTLDFRAGGHGQQQQAREQGPTPVVGTPEGPTEGVIGHPPDLRLAAQAQQPRPGEQGKTRPQGWPPHPPQSQQGQQAAEGRQHQQGQPSLSADKGGAGVKPAAEEGVHQGDQHGHHDAGSEPAAVVGMFLGHGEGLPAQP